MELYRRQLETGEVINYSIVDKQMQSGFSFNKRLLLLLDNQFVCYFRSPEIDFPLTKQYIQKNAKELVLMPKLSKISFKKEEKKLIVNYWTGEIKSKNAQKKWILKMNDDELLQKWMVVFDEYSNRSRNSTTQKKIQSEYEYDQKEGSIKKKPIQYKRNQSQSQSNSKQKQNLEKMKASVQKRQLPIKQTLEQSIVAINLNENQIKKDIEALKQQYKNIEEERQKIINVQLSKVKKSSNYFLNASSDNQQNSSFVKSVTSTFSTYQNYYRPYLKKLSKCKTKLEKQQNLKQINKKYSNFMKYVRQKVVQFIDGQINKYDQSSKYHSAKFKKHYGKEEQKDSSMMRYDEIEDITIEIAFSELKNIKDNNNVCDESRSKIIKQYFNNLEYLYQIIADDEILSQHFYIPMSAIVSYKGFNCLVSTKINPSEEPEFQNINPNDIQSDDQESYDVSYVFQRLSLIGKITFSLFQNTKNIKFVPKNKKNTKFAIIYAKQLLPPLQYGLFLRKQAFKNIYPSQLTQKSEFYNHLGSRKQNEDQINKMTTYLHGRIEELGQEIQKLEVYPIHPLQFGNLLHCYGLNVKYLALICNKINQSFAKNMFKTEAAARSFRMIFKKKMQEQMLRQDNRKREEIHLIGKSMLNLILGNSQESNLLWKVLVIHCQVYFNLPLEKHEINKGYFILSLAYHLNIHISPKYQSVDKLFQVNDFVQSIKFSVICEGPCILPKYLCSFEEEWEYQNGEALMEKFINDFCLEEKQFPEFIKDRPFLNGKLMNMMAAYISPKDQKFKHLEIYLNQELLSQEANTCKCSLHYLKKKMIEIKWEIRYQTTNNQQIIRLLNKLKDQVQSTFGRCHPFLSEIFELESTYFQSQNEIDQAIQTHKKSLTNMILLCGHNNKHLKLSNNYYQMGQCYFTFQKIEQAMNCYRKVKNILEVNEFQKQGEYGLVLLKIGIILHSTSNDDQAYDYFKQAAIIFESNITSNWDELITVYQRIQHCEIKKEKTTKPTFNRLSGIVLAEHCISLLSQVLTYEAQQEQQYEICSDTSFQKVFRIILEEYMKTMKQEALHIYRTYIINLCDQLSTQSFIKSYQLVSGNITKSIDYFKELVLQGDFCTTLQSYIDNSYDLIQLMKNVKKMKNLMISTNGNKQNKKSASQLYQEFMVHMIVVCGEAFVINSM